jgi:hypothetical protein
MRLPRHLLLFGVLVGLLVPALSTKASADTLKPALQAVVLLKVLTFDSALESRTGKNLRIGVLSDESSKKSAKSMVSAFTAGAKKLTVRGRKVQAFAVGLDDLSNIDVVYLPSSHTDAATAAKQANRAGLAVLCGDKSLLRSGGSVAVISEAGKPRIYVSQSGIKNIMSLDSKLIRLAKLVR